MRADDRSRVNAAASGEKDEELNLTPAMRSQYRRSARQYPYRSHLQWIRAFYACFFCLLLILFQGWRTFIAPMDADHFVASYISVSSDRPSVSLHALARLMHIPWARFPPLSCSRPPTSSRRAASTPPTGTGAPKGWSGWTRSVPSSSRTRIIASRAASATCRIGEDDLCSQRRRALRLLHRR